MRRQYIKFLINGGLLGIAALYLQWLIYNLMGGNSSFEYAIASALTYIPLIIINFAIQRSWIFKRHGIFWHFVIANLTIMLLVSLMSPLCRNLIDILAGSPWGDRGGFLVAALLGSIPSFLLKRQLVFRGKDVS